MNEKFREKPKYLLEMCANCGLNFGAHHGGSYYSEVYKMFVPYGCCPGHQNRMDWDKGPGTVFKGTGIYADVPYGTPAKIELKEVICSIHFRKKT